MTYLIWNSTQLAFNFESAILFVEPICQNINEVHLYFLNDLKIALALIGNWDMDALRHERQGGLKPSYIFAKGFLGHAEIGQNGPKSHKRSRTVEFLSKIEF